MISRANIPNALTRTTRRIRLNGGGLSLRSKEADERKNYGAQDGRPASRLESLYDQVAAGDEQGGSKAADWSGLLYDTARLLAPSETSSAFVDSLEERSKAPAKAAQERLLKKIELAKILDESKVKAYEFGKLYEQKDREIEAKALKYANKASAKQAPIYSPGFMKELYNLVQDASNSEAFLEKLDRAESYVDNGTVKPGGWTGEWKNTPIVGRVLNFFEGDNNAHVQDLDAITNELNISKGKSQVGMQHLGPKMVSQLAKDKPGLGKDKEAFKNRANDFRKPHQKIIEVQDGVDQLMEQGASEDEIRQFLVLARAKRRSPAAHDSTHKQSDEPTREQKIAALKVAERARQ